MVCLINITELEDFLNSIFCRINWNNKDGYADIECLVCGTVIYRQKYGEFWDVEEIKKAAKLHYESHEKDMSNPVLKKPFEEFVEVMKKKKEGR